MKFDIRTSPVIRYLNLLPCYLHFRGELSILVCFREGSIPSFTAKIFQFVGMWFEPVNLAMFICKQRIYPQWIFQKRATIQTIQPHQQDIYIYIYILSQIHIIFRSRYLESNPYSGQNTPLPSSMIISSPKNPAIRGRQLPISTPSSSHWRCQQVTCWHPRRSASGRQSQSKSLWNLGRKLPRRPGLAMAMVSFCRKHKLEDCVLR